MRSALRRGASGELLATTVPHCGPGPRLPLSAQLVPRSQSALCCRLAPRSRLVLCSQLVRRRWWVRRRQPLARSRLLPSVQLVAKLRLALASVPRRQLAGSRLAPAGFPPELAVSATEPDGSGLGWLAGWSRGLGPAGEGWVRAVSGGRAVHHSPAGSMAPVMPRLAAKSCGGPEVRSPASRPRRAGGRVRRTPRRPDWLPVGPRGPALGRLAARARDPSPLRLSVSRALSRPRRFPSRG